MKTPPKLLLYALLLSGLVTQAAGPVRAETPTVAALLEELPQRAEDCNAPRAQRLDRAATALESWAARLAWQREELTAEQAFAATKVLLDAKRQVDGALDKTLPLRAQFPAMADDRLRRQAIRSFLKITSELIDVSGRLRYLLRDAIDEAAYHAAEDPKMRLRLLDELIRQRSSIGAVVMSVLLEDPDAKTDIPPVSQQAKGKVLMLVAATRQVDLLPEVSRMALDKKTPPGLVVAAAEVIRLIGLPQDPHPAQDDKLPAPPITARPLHEVLARLDPARLSAKQQAFRIQLLDWLATRIKHGVMEDSYRIGDFKVQAGDWLLMRNPSPYNMFTDLRPGLFTHVGVVSVVKSPDGIRRFVLVDLPERGDRIPVTNVETYLNRTLHFFFLRHKEPAVGRKMGQVAADLIGNETQFDLTFRTSRVTALRGHPLKGKRIHTYCAGFLLLCAQETAAPPEQFFPVPEYPAGGNTASNLKRLGLSIGSDFVSPTGAIFSEHLSIVGRRQPMYNPVREIKEAIYDQFALAMREQVLTPSPDAYQALRERLAAMSKDNPWLAKALASASGVSQHMDLVSAAKAAAVVETLDDVVDRASNEYLVAREAIVAGPVNELAEAGYRPAEIEQFKKFRLRHAKLLSRWEADQLSPRDLRVQLVRHYIQRGEAALDARFFTKRD